MIDTMESTEGWEPIISAEPHIVNERYPHERALAYAFMVWPEESITAWKARVGGIPNPGSTLFRDERCRLFVQKIIELHKKGVKQLSNFVLKQNCTGEEIESFGGWKHIVGHYEFMLVGAGFHGQMDLLLDQYRVLEMQKLMQFASDSVADGNSLNDVIAMVGDKSRALLKVESGMLTPSATVCLDEMDKKTTEDAVGEGIPTSFREFSRFVGDYKRTYITLVGAPPGNGKTAFAMQEIQCALEHNFVVDAFLMESTFGQYTDRFLMRNYRIRGGKLKSKFFTKDELHGIHAGMEKLSAFENRLFLAPPENYSAAGIEAKIQERKASTGLPCDLIVVDHLDCMDIPRDKGESQFEAMKRTVLYLRSIAARENAAMLLCSQLSVDAIRNSVGAKEKFPTLDAFRGGTPTEAAKVVMILNKDKQAMLDGSEVVEQQMVICKANDGQTGFVRSLFLKPYAMHIEDCDRANRAQYEQWLDSLNYPLDTERTDVRNRK